nr:hypothetical protein [Pseudonocardia sp. ICBG601]
MRSPLPRPLGRHEHGQNFLVDDAVPAAMAAVVAGYPPGRCWSWAPVTAR